MRTFNIHKDVVVLEDNALAAEKMRAAALKAKVKKQEETKDEKGKTSKTVGSKKDKA